VSRFLLISAVVGLMAASLFAQNKKPTDKNPKDSPAAASTRKKLETKVTVDYKDELLKAAVEDLKRQVENLSIWIDNAGGVSNNTMITYKADDKPLAEVLDGMFKQNDLGYLIGQAKDKRYDGWLIIKKGKYRGDEEIPKTTVKEAPKEKDKAKPPEKKPAEESGDKTEQEAAGKLKIAKKLQEEGVVDKAKERYQEIVKKYPKTEAAKEAQKLLEKLDK